MIHPLTPCFSGVMRTKWRCGVADPPASQSSTMRSPVNTFTSSNGAWKEYLSKTGACWLAARPPTITAAHLRTIAAPPPPMPLRCDVAKAGVDRCDV